MKKLGISRNNVLSLILRLYQLVERLSCSSTILPFQEILKNMIMNMTSTTDNTFFCPLALGPQEAELLSTYQTWTDVRAMKEQQGMVNIGELQVYWPIWQDCSELQNVLVSNQLYIRSHLWMPDMWHFQLENIIYAETTGRVHSILDPTSIVPSHQ